LPFFDGQASTCASLLGGARILRTQLTPVSFEGVTKFALPSSIRDPNGLVTVTDDQIHQSALMSLNVSG
jgi:hypothetical protein